MLGSATVCKTGLPGATSSLMSRTPPGSTPSRAATILFVALAARGPASATPADDTATVADPPAARETATGPEDNPADTLTPAGLGDKERRALEALGYLSATQAAPKDVGVRSHDPARAWDGLNLWVSAHRQVAFLMDMHGELLHEWSFQGKSARVAKTFRPERLPGLPEFPVYFRRAHLYPNGSLLVQRDFQSLLLLDKDSKLLWEFEEPTHHDVHVNPDGSIYVLVRKWRKFPFLDPTSIVADDEVVKLGPRGKVLGRVSILDAALKGLKTKLLAELRRGQERQGRFKADPLHTNAIDVLEAGADAREPAFKPGRILLSARTINALLLLDFEKRAIVWWKQGAFIGQHDPRMLEGGTVLLFDNLGTVGHSAVVEMDPATGEELWAYRGTDEQPFHTMCCGTARRLPNGNTLIVETEKGRAFEVTKDKEVVWEFVNPHKLGVYGAMLQDLIRLPRDVRATW
jgi:hypothetical protein